MVHRKLRWLRLRPVKPPFFLYGESNSAGTGRIRRAAVVSPVSQTRRIVRCPTCRKEGPWLEGDYLPFCSKRCKLVDLGKWLDEENRTTEPLRPEHFEGYENLPPGEYLDRPEQE